MSNWLTEELKEKVRKVFEPRYNRQLSDNEVCEIAYNLVAIMETYAKFKWKKLYGNQKQ